MLVGHDIPERFRLRMRSLPRHMAQPKSPSSKIIVRTVPYFGHGGATRARITTQFEVATTGLLGRILHSFRIESYPIQVQRICPADMHESVGAASFENTMSPLTRQRSIVA